MGNLNTFFSYTSGSAGSLILVLEDAIAENGDDSTDSTKLRILGKYFLYKKMLVDVSYLVDYSVDKSSYKMGSMYDMILSGYNDALAEAGKYLTNSPYSVGVQNYRISSSGSRSTDEYTSYCYP